MQSLATLIKLQKTRVDEQRLLLSKLQARLESIQQAIAELEIRKAREQLTVEQNPEMALTYGEFLRWAIEQARELEKQRLTAVKAVDIARDRLASAFEEQKRYELAEAARLEEEKREELRKETIEMDEIGSVSFIRKKKKAKR